MIIILLFIVSLIGQLYYTLRLCEVHNLKQNNMSRCCVNLPWLKYSCNLNQNSFLNCIGLTVTITTTVQTKLMVIKLIINVIIIN